MGERKSVIASSLLGGGVALLGATWFLTQRQSTKRRRNLRTALIEITVEPKGAECHFLADIKKELAATPIPEEIRLQVVDAPEEAAGDSPAGAATSLVVRFGGTLASPIAPDERQILCEIPLPDRRIYRVLPVQATRSIVNALAVAEKRADDERSASRLGRLLLSAESPDRWCRRISTEARMAEPELEARVTGITRNVVFKGVKALSRRLPPLPHNTPQLCNRFIRSRAQLFVHDVLVCAEDFSPGLPALDSLVMSLSDPSDAAHSKAAYLIKELGLDPELDDALLAENDPATVRAAFLANRLLIVNALVRSSIGKHNAHASNDSSSFPRPVDDLFADLGPLFMFTDCSLDAIACLRATFDACVELSGGGGLSYDNFIVLMEYLHGDDLRESVRSRSSRFFRSMNTSRSGAITFKELCVWVARHLTKQSDLGPDRHLVSVLMILRLPLLLFVPLARERRSAEASLWASGRPGAKAGTSPGLDASLGSCPVNNSSFNGSISFYPVAGTDAVLPTAPLHVTANARILEFGQNDDA